MYLHNAIATHRKGWALTQRELGELLATTRSNISRLESKSGQPALATALAVEALFGVPVSELFPAAFSKAVAEIIPRVAAFSIPLESVVGSIADRKRELLLSVVERLSTSDPLV